MSSIEIRAGTRSHRVIAARVITALSAATVALGLAACETVPAAPQALAAQAIGEKTVAIATPDGTADALLFTPAGAAPAPAVILWSDISGLRPVFGDIARRLAGAGYVVLVPNAFYRNVKLDGSAGTALPLLEFGETMKRGSPWRAAASDEAVIADTRAYMGFLDALPQVDTSKKAGVVGYNIGGAHAFIAARAMPQRIGAVAAIHPLAIATARDSSPHLYVNQSKAAYLVEIAQPDDAREPGDKDDLRKAFADAGLTGTVEILAADHGFAVPDSPAFDAAASDKTWDDTMALLEDQLR